MSLLFALAVLGNGLFTGVCGILIESFLTTKKRFLSPILFFFTPILFMYLSLLPGLGVIDDPGMIKACISYSIALITVIFCYKDKLLRKIFFTFVGLSSVVPIELVISIPMSKYQPKLYDLFANGAYDAI